MGRQINFFIEKEKEDEFVRFAYENGLYVIEDNFDKNEIYEYKTFEEYILFHKLGKLYFYKEGYNKLIIEDFFLDSTINDVIEFSRTGYIFDRKCITSGRIWFEYEYYNDNDKLVTKNEQLIKDYEMLSRWIKRNAPLHDFVVSIDGKDCYFKKYMTKKMIEYNESRKYKFL